MAEYIYDTAKAKTLPTQGVTGERIVRCRNCIWAKQDQSDHENRGEYYRCNMWIADVGANGFCSRGLERKEAR